jgi:salicylate 5-hydroxylase large subunit
MLVNNSFFPAFDLDVYVTVCILSGARWLQKSPLTREMVIMADQDMAVDERHWPEAGVTRVPFWAYSDPQVYKREMEIIFCGDSWAYVGLGVEIPQPGDFKQVMIGDRPLIMSRDGEGTIHVFVNRCAHRGVKFCRQPWGNVKTFTCPYHLWSYDLKGHLRGLPFHHGVKGQGGMPDDFNRDAHGLEELRVSTRGGAVFATFSHTVEAFEDYLGPTFLSLYDRVFDGRELTLLGYTKQLIPSNWKLMFENIKDPYHASLMHVFLVTFGLFRADQPSAVKMDAKGRHGALISMKGDQQSTADNAEMQNLKADFRLHDPRLLDPVREYPGNETVVMQTLWPNLILQQQSNTLAMRQIIPRGPEQFELAWTFFGYADDSEEMHLRRLRQANLMGPAGLVSADDSEVMKLSQDGMSPYPEASSVVEMGGRGVAETDHMVTEAAIRAFYDYYCRVMGF